MRSGLLGLLIVELGIALGVGPGLPAAAQQPQPGGDRQPSGRDQPPRLPPDQQAAGLLHEAYDNLSLVRIWLGSDRAQFPPEQAKLADQADDFYRSAHRAYKERDYGRSIGMSIAAMDASRGLLSALHASTKPLDGLPAPPAVPVPESRGADAGRGTGSGDQQGPPARPQDAAVEVLRAARQQIIAADKADSGKGPAGRFLDASRTVYEQGRQAYEKGDYDRALDLGAAAEAWSRIADDLRRAENPDQPGDRRPRAEPLPDRPPAVRP
jgi:hypothetical protein